MFGCLSTHPPKSRGSRHRFLGLQRNAVLYRQKDKKRPTHRVRFCFPFAATNELGNRQKRPSHRGATPAPPRERCARDRGRCGGGRSRFQANSHGIQEDWELVPNKMEPWQNRDDFQGTVQKTHRKGPGVSSLSTTAVMPPRGYRVCCCYHRSRVFVRLSSGAIFAVPPGLPEPCLTATLAHLCCRVDSSPVPDPLRRPRWDVLKEGGFSSKFKDAFNALLSDVIPCEGDGRAVRWPHREASPGRTR